VDPEDEENTLSKDDIGGFGAKLAPSTRGPRPLALKVPEGVGTKFHRSVGCAPASHVLPTCFPSPSTSVHSFAAPASTHALHLLHSSAAPASTHAPPFLINQLHSRSVSVSRVARHPPPEKPFDLRHVFDFTATTLNGWVCD
jgi:hypothetical protein